MKPSSFLNKNIYLLERVRQRQTDRQTENDSESRMEGGRERERERETGRRGSVCEREEAGEGQREK